MKSFKIKDGYLLRLDKGEEVVNSILEFVKDSGMKSATVSAIGSLTDCVLGYFDRDKKTYIHKNFNDVYELVSLMGNITFFDDQPILHAHICLGDMHCNIYGGHLFSATVAVTAEVFLLEAGIAVNRSLVGEFGLNLIDSEKND